MTHGRAFIRRTRFFLLLHIGIHLIRFTPISVVTQFCPFLPSIKIINMSSCRRRFTIHIQNRQERRGKSFAHMIHERYVPFRRGIDWIAKVLMVTASFFIGPIHFVCLQLVRQLPISSKQQWSAPQSRTHSPTQWWQRTCCKAILVYYSISWPCPVERPPPHPPFHLTFLYINLYKYCIIH